MWIQVCFSKHLSGQAHTLGAHMYMPLQLFVSSQCGIVKQNQRWTKKKTIVIETHT